MDELYAIGNNITQKHKGLLTILKLSHELNKMDIRFLKVDLYKPDAVKFQIKENMYTS